MAQFSTPTPTLSVTIHFVTDRQTDGWTDRRQYHASNRSYCMQEYDRLKTELRDIA